MPEGFCLSQYISAVLVEQKGACEPLSEITIVGFHPDLELEVIVQTRKPVVTSWCHIWQPDLMKRRLRTDANQLRSARNSGRG